MRPIVGRVRPVRRVRQNGTLAAAGLLVVVLLAGCAVEDRVAAAERAIRSARDAHADYLAPYEFHSAEIYLAGAKEQMMAADEDRASRYAERALAMAQAAQARARNDSGLATGGRD